MNVNKEINEVRQGRCRDPFLGTFQLEPSAPFSAPTADGGFVSPSRTFWRVLGYQDRIPSPPEVVTEIPVGQV